MLRRGAAIALVLVAVALIGAGPRGGHGAQAQAEVQGDVNCDSHVNSVDSLQILRSVAGLSTSAACLPAAADVNCDSAVNSVDSLRILRYVAGLPNSTPDGCIAIGDPLGGGASSFDLIDDALSKGQITQDQALVYTAFAAFGDSRLPSQYTGDNSDTDDTLVLQRLASAFDALSPADQAAVTPFLLPPSATGSWLDLPTAQGAAPAQLDPAAITWQTFTAAGGKVKVWAQDRYPGDAEKAQGVAQAMTNRIYPLLVGLMGRTPPGDDGLPNNGGDGAIDIYLIHMADRGEMKNYGNSCNKGPGYIIVNSDRPLGSETSPGIIQTAAHEFFHILEWTFQLAACWHPQYRWAVEGFAKWSEDYAYPQAQSEHSYAPHLLNDPTVSLDEPEGEHAYGTYLFPYYLSRKVQNADLVRQIWTAFEGDANSTRAAGSVVGGWDDVWPQVALYNWNREPVDDYKDLDQLPHGAMPHGGAPEEIGTGGIVLADVVNHLSAIYYDLKFLDEARSVEYEGNGIGGMPDLHVWALQKIAGSWKPAEDWTDEDYRQFCRDLPGQDLQELVLIVSNSDGETKQDTDPGQAAPQVEAKDVGCNKWKGWVKHTHHGGLIYGADATETEMADNVVFELDPNLLDPHLPPRYWVTTGGHVHWEHSGSFAGCSGSGSGDYEIGSLSAGEGFGQLDIWDDGGQRLRYNAVGTGPLPPPTTVMYDCPPPDGGQIPGGPVAVGIWWSLDYSEFRIQPDGTIRDSVTINYPAGMGDDTWEWEFRQSP